MDNHDTPKASSAAKDGRGGLKEMTVYRHAALFAKRRPAFRGH